MSKEFDDLMSLKDPDLLFDAICLANYVKGFFNLNIPVDESRMVFKKIKSLLKKEKT